MCNVCERGVGKCATVAQGGAERRGLAASFRVACRLLSAGTLQASPLIGTPANTMKDTNMSHVRATEGREEMFVRSACLESAPRGAGPVGRSFWGAGESKGIPLQDQN